MRLSVLIATHERRELLRVLLDSLGRQTQAPGDFEVVVVVDGSRDGTLAMLDEYRRKAPYRLAFEGQRQSGKPAAINRAAAIASAPYCLVLDDDMRPAPELVSEHLRLQEARGGVVGVGPMKLEVPPDADGMTRWFSRDWEARYERIRRAPESLTYKQCFGGNLSFPRSAFLEVGGWLHIDRGDDVELGYRLERGGLPVVCPPDAWSTQYFPGGFRRLARDARLSGWGGAAIYERHPATLPITIGHFREATPRSLLLRELLLLTRPPAGLLDKADPVIRRLPESDAVYATIHSYFLWRGVRDALGAGERWRALKRGTVILAYEASAQDGGGRPPGRLGLALQLSWLKRRGYRVIGLDDYVGERSEFRIPHHRAVIIILDGGCREVMEAAPPLLAKLGLPATVFLDPEGPTRERINDLPGGGFQFGLYGQAPEGIAGARETLESHLGRPVAHLACRPWAEDAGLGPLGEEAGFRTACGPGVGSNSPATPLHALRRAPVTGRLSFARFLLAIWTGYASRRVGSPTT